MNVQTYTIISHLLDAKPAALSFLFEEGKPGCLRASAARLREESWAFSNDERIFLWAALYIAADEGKLFVWDLLSLKADSFLRIVRALYAIKMLRALGPLFKALNA
jgi:hypothetical protein